MLIFEVDTDDVILISYTNINNKSDQKLFQFKYTIKRKRKKNN